MRRLLSKCGFATLLNPHGGRTTRGVGLGALFNKCGFATLLDPHGGRTTRGVGLGALSKWVAAQRHRRSVVDVNRLFER